MSKKTEDQGLTVAQPSALGLITGDTIQSENGFENVTTGDIAIPFITILQALSPQVKKGSNARIEGAEEGDIYFTVSGKIVEGSKGIHIVPAFFQKVYVEWRPRLSGGGFVKQHLDESILEKTTKGSKNEDLLENGNNIVTTAYHYVVIKADVGYERAVISMTSTQLKKSRKWLSQMMSLQIVSNGAVIRPPMYSHIYPLSTKLEEKDNHSWYGWNIGTPQLIDNPELYIFARAFFQDVKKGYVKVSQAHDETESLPSTDTNLL